MTRSKVYGFIIISLIFFHAINNYIWLKKDCESIHGCCDLVHHTKRAILIHQRLKEIFSSRSPVGEKFSEIFSILSGSNKKEYSRWPTLVPFIAASISFLFKDILFGIRFSNMIYFSIIVIACYLIGKNLYNKEAGLLSAILVSFYPAIFGSSRKFGLDFPLVAIVVTSFYFLIKTEKFKNPYYSIIFGLCSGIGTLVKFQFLIFLFAPSIYILYQSFREDRYKLKKFFLLFFILILGSLISSIWWRNLFLPAGRRDVLLRLSYPLRMIAYHRYDIFIKALRLSIRGMFLNLSPIFFVMFVGSIFFYFRNMNKNKYLLFIWIIIPYICFTFVLLWGIGDKFRPPEFRHLFPIYPAISLFSAIGWLESPVSKKSIKILTIIFFLLTGISQFFILSYYTELPFVDSRYAHPPERNNHLMVMKKFNDLMQNFNFTARKIGIIEERYFNNDECVRLGYFLKLLDTRNNVFLSAEGVLPSRTSREFLYTSSAFDFLIVFSESSSHPDFSGLEFFSPQDQRALAEKVIKIFKNYKILEKDKLLPEGINVFLLKK